MVKPFEKEARNSGISVINYSRTDVKESKPKTPKECFKLLNQHGVTWINISRKNKETIDQICDYFKIHPLIQENILSKSQRLKVEEFTDHLFIVLKRIQPNGDIVKAGHVSLIVGKNYLISFQDNDEDDFSKVKEEIRTNKGKIRSEGPDYLVYRIMDGIIDQTFSIMEKTGEKVESIENELVANPQQSILNKIRALKKEVIFIRRSIWPLRDISTWLQRGESTFVKKTTIPYFREIYDHTVQVIEAIELDRETAAEMTDIYLLSISNKTNEVMKVLTIIATIFIPLTFVTGVYGMNFPHMPEMSWTWGYQLIWIVMIVLGITMMIYFKKKKWF